MPKEELTSLVKDAIAEGNQNLKREIKADMQTLREDILAESLTYTDIMIQDLRTKIDGQLDNIDN
jgi:Zn-dependent M16 (insulinase) family peptidase